MTITCVTFQFGQRSALEELFFHSFKQQTLLKLLVWTNQEALLNWQSDSVEIRIASVEEFASRLGIPAEVPPRGVQGLGLNHRLSFWKLLEDEVSSSTLWAFCDTDLLWGRAEILKEAAETLKENSVLTFSRVPSDSFFIAKGKPAEGAGRSGSILVGSKWYTWPELQKQGKLKTILYPWYPEQSGEPGASLTKSAYRTETGQLFVVNHQETHQEVFAIHLTKWKRGMAQIWELERDEEDREGLPGLTIQKGFAFAPDQDDYWK